jgi:hypothetical protein
MAIRPLKPHLTVLGLLIATSFLLAFTIDVSISDEAGIKLELPDRVGEWIGEEVRFCQNSACQKTFTTSQLTDFNVCPACTGRLDNATIPEKQLLPADTVLLKKKYHNAAGDVIFSSIVVSGKERASIHRPEVCLTGQGSEIVKQHVVPVPMRGRGPLQVMVLDMLRRNLQGQQSEYFSYYAYWFVGKGRETPYHMWRMIWMASDRVLHNRSHRWAYIAVNGIRQNKSEAYLETMKKFIADLYPQISLN